MPSGNCGADGQQYGVDEHIAGCRAKQRVEGGTGTAAYPAPRGLMHQQIRYRGNHEPVSHSPHGSGEHYRRITEQQVCHDCRFLAEAHHGGALARFKVIIAVAVVVDYQYIHSHQSYCERAADDIFGHRPGLQIERKAYWHKSEKQQHGHVAQSYARQRHRSSTVGKRKHGNHRPHWYQLPPAERD